jgi:hypothetical protein
MLRMAGGPQRRIGRVDRDVVNRFAMWYRMCGILIFQSFKGFAPCFLKNIPCSVLKSSLKAFLRTGQKTLYCADFRVGVFLAASDSENLGSNPSPPANDFKQLVMAVLRVGQFSKLTPRIQVRNRDALENFQSSE